jgi:adrenodoxin-NADP+ reductase
LDGSAHARVDVFEELPVPFGLVRFGVAPDHPEVKVRRSPSQPVCRAEARQNCEHKFEQTAEDPRFRYFGNVQIGAASRNHFVAPHEVEDTQSSTSSATLPLQYLRDHYDAVLLTYGASHDRPLDIPGEDNLANVLSARDFVHFYNGHPNAAVTDIDLSAVEHVTIIGQGNVAFDCARLLLAPLDALATTDIADRTLAQLSRSRVKRVDVVGRRGPLQLAGTTKELRELLHLPGVAFDVDPLLVAQAETALATRPAERARRRLLALMKQGAQSPGDAKSWALQFLRSPVAFHGSAEGKVTGVDWEVNELAGEDPMAARARPTGERVTTATDLVLKSVGYRSVGIPGLPFDDRAGIVRNVNGRVVDGQGQRVRAMHLRLAGYQTRATHRSTGYILRAGSHGDRPASSPRPCLTPS